MQIQKTNNQQSFKSWFYDRQSLNGARVKDFQLVDSTIEKASDQLEEIAKDSFVYIFGDVKDGKLSKLGVFSLPFNVSQNKASEVMAKAQECLLNVSSTHFNLPNNYRNVEERNLTVDNLLDAAKNSVVASGKELS